MQYYNQPQFGGLPQLNQNSFVPFVYQPPTPIRNTSNFDYIVGEGDIIPSQQLDGTQRFFFIPRATYPQNRRPCWCNRQPCCCNWLSPDQVQAWFVRSIAISFEPPVPPFFNTLPIQDQVSHLWNLQNQQNLMNQQRITFSIKMQYYNQPQFGGLPQLNQNSFVPFVYQPPTPIRNTSNFDYIVGEGDIIPSQQLDGTQRFFFIPRATYPQNRRPCWCNRQPCCCNWLSPDQVQAWFVRSIAISFEPPVPPFFNTLPIQDQVSHLWNLQNQQNLMNQQRITFHSDNGTSTTDLYLYFPILRSNLWEPRPCACVQTSPSVDEPSTCQCNSQQAIQEKTQKNHEEKKKNQYTGSLEHVSIDSFEDHTSRSRPRS